MSTEALVAAIVAITFDVPEDVARQHVEAAALAAEEFHVSIELLLGMVHIDPGFLIAQEGAA